MQNMQGSLRVELEQVAMVFCSELALTEVLHLLGAFCGCTATP